MVESVVLLTLAFGVTNGFHDSANAVAALVATRAARPGAAVLLAAGGNVVGALAFGTAVASTVAGIVAVPTDRVLPVLGAAVTTAIAWNAVTWWRGLPSSSSHALVGGLVGACTAEAGWSAVQWGDGSALRVTGVLAVVVVLAVSPVLGGLAGFALIRLSHRVLRRARRRVARPVRGLQWLTAGALACTQGANDAQKTMGVVTLALLAGGDLSAFAVPLWVRLASAVALTVGTALGGWRIVRTVGRGIYPMRPLDGLVSQGSAATVILAAAAVGAPVSTTHVVAAGVVGVGAGRHRQHVRWAVVGEMGSAWLVTLPLTGVAAAALLPLWRWWA